MAYGVTATGFEKKTIDVILSELEAEAQNQFGVTVDLTSTSPLKMLLETVALEIARIWDMAENLWASGFVDYAEGDSLDDIGALMNTPRQAATQSSGSERFSGVGATVIPLGAQVSTPEGLLFQTTVADVIGGGGYVDVPIRSVGFGEDYNVSGGAISNLVSSIPGCSSVVNQAGLVGGAEKETDAVYRLRIKGALEGLGKGTLLAIVNTVKAVTGVTGCVGTENTTNHTAHLYVSGSPVGTDVDDAIVDSKPAGIFVDWDPVIADNIDVDVEVTITAAAPGGWAALVEDSITAYLDGLGAGEKVVWSKVMDAVYDTEEVDGVSQGWITDVPAADLKINGFAADFPIANNKEASAGTITVIPTP